MMFLGATFYWDTVYYNHSSICNCLPKTVSEYPSWLIGGHWWLTKDDRQTA